MMHVKKIIDLHNNGGFSTSPRFFCEMLRTQVIMSQREPEEAGMSVLDSWSSTGANTTWQPGSHPQVNYY
jgi:hypothetical protein